MKLNQFCESFPVPSLARAVVRQLGGWDSFRESAPDISNHGIDGGFHGFIYYRDTCKFTTKNRAAILELAEMQAEDFGVSAISMIEGFNCLQRSTVTESEIGRVLFSARGGDPDARQLIENALAWYAGEEVSRHYADQMGV